MATRPSYPPRPGFSDGPCKPTDSRLKVFRGGSSITGKVPKPVILVDTREQTPFNLAPFGNWIAGERVATLETGDYSIEGMESLVSLERKSLQDVVGSLTHGRERFIRQMERMTAYRHRAIIIEATYEQIKTPYSFASLVEAHPNGISGSLDAIEARYGIPIIYTSSNRALAAEKAASWLSKAFTYEWLETQGMGRYLKDGDL